VKIVHEGLVVSIDDIVIFPELIVGIIVLGNRMKIRRICFIVKPQVDLTKTMVNKARNIMFNKTSRDFEKKSVRKKA
jgi:hypothetical protein